MRGCWLGCATTTPSPLGSLVGIYVTKSLTREIITGTLLRAPRQGFYQDATSILESNLDKLTTLSITSFLTCLPSEGHTPQEILQPLWCAILLRWLLKTGRQSTGTLLSGLRPWLKGPEQGNFTKGLGGKLLEKPRGLLVKEWQEWVLTVGPEKGFGTRRLKT